MRWGRGAASLPTDPLPTFFSSRYEMQMLQLHILLLLLNHDKSFLSGENLIKCDALLDIERMVGPQSFLAISLSLSNFFSPCDLSVRKT